MMLRYQIDQVCAETGIEVEALLQETKDGFDEKRQKVRVQKYTIGEILKDDFSPNGQKQKYRSVSGMEVVGRPDDPSIPSVGVEIDVDDMVD
jgi:hypothetical protein